LPEPKSELKPKPQPEPVRLALAKPRSLLYRITILCVFGLLILGGYIASEWIQGRVYEAVELELSRLGVSNLQIDGGSIRWFGANIHSLSFDLERGDSRYTVSLNELSAKSSLEAIQLRKIDQLAISSVNVLINQANSVQTSSPQIHDAAPFQAKDIPIPSDLFLLLPVDKTSVQQFTIRHQKDNWYINSASELLINREELRGDLTVHNQAYPIVKLGVEMSASNHLVLNIEPELASPEPLVIELQSQLDKQYEKLSVQLSADVQASDLRAFLSIDPLIALIENKSYLQQYQELVADLTGSVSLVSDIQLPFSSFRAESKSMSELLDELLAGATSGLEGLVSIEYEFSRQEPHLALQGVANWNVGTHFLDINVKKISLDSASIQEQLDKVEGNTTTFTGGRMTGSVVGSVNSDELKNVGGSLPNLPSLSLKGQLRANEASLIVSDLELTQVQANTSFSVKGEQVEFITKALSVGKIAYGVTLDSVEGTFSGQGKWNDGVYSVTLDSLVGNLLGGELSLLPFSMTGPALNAEFEVHLSNIDLAEVLALQANDELSGEGTLSGFLQVTVNDSIVEIEEGHMSSGSIDSKDVAGRIRYKRNDAADAVADSDPSQQVDFLLQHMEDFHYTSLETGVKLTAPDNLLLAVGLRGGNPAFEEGRAVHLNLNLEQNISPLIETLGIDKLLNSNLLKQYQEN